MPVDGFDGSVVVVTDMTKEAKIEDFQVGGMERSRSENVVPTRDETDNSKEPSPYMDDWYMMIVCRKRRHVRRGDTIHLETLPDGVGITASLSKTDMPC